MIKQGTVEAKPAEDILQLITEGTASATGSDFFCSFVRCLAAALQVRYAFVTECTDVTMTRVRTLAFVQRSPDASPRGGAWRAASACARSAGKRPTGAWSRRSTSGRNLSRN